MAKWVKYENKMNSSKETFNAQNLIDLHFILAKLLFTIFKKNKFEKLVYEAHLCKCVKWFKMSR